MKSFGLKQVLKNWAMSRRKPVRRLRSAVSNRADTLERRIVPALNVTFSAGALAITESGGVDNDIEIYLSGSTLQIHDFNDTFSSAPAGTTRTDSNHRLNVPLASISSLSISTGAGDDIIDQFAQITGLSGNLTYNAERITLRDEASIDISGNISLTGTGSPATGRGVYVLRPAASGSSTIIRTTGNSTITITGTGGSTSGDNNAGVWIGTRPGTDSGQVLIESVNGNISILGTGGVWNTPSTDPGGNLPGTLISAATIRTTGNGSISITGHGPTSTDILYGDRDGISVYDDSIIETGSGGGISLTGSGRAGGEGIDTNDSDTVQLSAGTGGITITGSMADSGVSGGAVTLAGSIVSTGGAISITGTGGSGGTVAVSIAPNGASAPNVVLGNATTTTVTINGTVAGGSEDAVLITRVTAQSAGNFSVTGTSAETGEGLEITDSSITISSGAITLSGTSPGDGGLILDNADLFANNSSISVTGIGGTTGGSGLTISNGSKIGSSTTTSVALTGTARGGTGDSDGLAMSGGSITSTGAVTLQGTAVGAGEGLALSGSLTVTAGAAFSATGSAVNGAGAIEFSGVTINAGSPGITISGTSTGSAPGVVINSASLIAASGPITLTGTGGSTSGGNNAGVWIGMRSGTNSAQVLIETLNDDITIAGTGGVWNATSAEAALNLPGTMVGAATIRTTGSGNISITGYGPTASNVLYGDRDGISLYDHTVIQTGSAGSITLLGAGRGTGEGVDSNDSDTVQLSAGSGGLSITGSKADASTSGAGVILAGTMVSNGGTISITGTGSSAGTVGVEISSSTGATVTLGNSQTTTITIDGTASAGSQDGVRITQVNATSAGTFDAEGTGSGTGEGLEALNCTITVNSGSIILKGTSAADVGMILDNTDMFANNAAISITANGGTSGGDALDIKNSSIIGSATTTSVTITATARGGTSDNDGMIITGGSITATGNITLQGTAVADGEGIDLRGGTGTLVITAGGAFSATATAVNGSGALLLTDVSITSGSAGLTLDGLGTGTANGLDITSSSMVAANGPVVLIGETVDGDGIVIDSPGTIGNSTTTTVSLTGTATAGSGDNDGLNLTGVTIRASGTIGFAGTATDTGEGIEFTNIDLSTPGDVSIIGSAFNGFFAFDYDNSIVRSTAGSILITGTSTGSAIGVNLQGESTTAQQDAFAAALDITVRANAINFHASTGTASFTGERNLVIESIGTAFTSAVSTSFVSFGTDFDTIRIGKSTNTGAVTIGSNGASASDTITISAGTLTVSGDVTAGTSLNLSASTLNSDAGADLTAPSGISATVTTGGTLSGAITGSGSLTKLGAGSLTLAGTNTYTGATSINAGTIIATNSAALGTTAGDTTIASGAVLDVRANIGTEAITVSGTGVSSGGALITGSGTGTVGGAVTLAAASSIGGTGDLTISGAVGGSFAVTKVGTGTVTLSGTNTFTGATSINAGTVIATNSAALGTTAGATTIASGAALDVRANIGTEDITVSGNGISSGGALITVSGTGTVGGAVTLAADSSIGGAGDLTISGAVGGSFAVTKVGAGTVTLSGTNTFTGATSINAGIIVATNSAALGTTAGTTTITSGAALDVRANIGTEAITVSGNGVSAGGALITGSGTGTVGGAVTLAADSSVGGAGDLTISGAVGGSFAVTKVGAGTVTLSGTNTFTGATSINAGTIVATNSAALGTTAGATTITSGAALDVRANIGTEDITVSGNGISSGGGLITGSGSGTVGGAVTLAADSSLGGAGVLTISGAVGGSFAVTKVGAGTVTLSGTNTFTGATSINAGTIVATNSAALGTTAGATTISSGAALDVRANLGTEDITVSGTGISSGGAMITSSGSGTVGGAVTLAADSSIGGAGDLTISGAIGGNFAVTKVGAGIVTLSGTNTHTGATLVNSGTILATNSAALGTTAGDTTIASGAVLDVRANIGTEAITVSGNGISSGGALITGSGTGTVGGAVTLAADSSLGGAGNLSVSGAIGGSFAVTKVGSGTLTFSGANTYTGATAISGGTLLVNGSTTINSDITVASGSTLGGNLTVSGEVSVTSGGTVAPGTSPGILNTGSITFTSGSSFDVEIGGTAVGTQYDQLNVTGTVDLGGATLNLIQFNTFVISSASLQTYVIINNDGTDDVVGTFAGLPEGSPVTYAGMTLYISYAGSATGDAGNDVVLNSHPIINGTSVANTFVFRKSTTANRNEFSTDGGTSFIQVDNTLPVRFNGATGVDSLNINYVNGDPAVAVAFHGGGQAGDLLTISDTIAGGRTGVYSIDSSAPTNAGALTVAGRALTFTGVSQVDATGIATVNLDSTTFPVANTVLAIAGDTNSAGQAAVRISGTTGGTAFTPLLLRNATTLSVNTSAPSGNDTVTISNITGSSAGLTNLTVNTGTGTDSITVGGNASPVNLSGNIALTSGGTLTVNQFGVISAGNVTLNAGGTMLIGDNGINTSSGSGNVSASTTSGTLTVQGSGLTTAGNVTLSAPGSVTVTSFGISATAGSGTVQVTSTAAGVTVNSGGIQAKGTITIQAAGTSTLSNVVNSTGTGNISVTNTVGQLTVNSTGLHSAGNISLSSDGLITVTNGGVIATAGTGTVQVTSTAAGVTVDQSGIQAKGTITIQAAGASSVSNVNNTTGTGNISITTTAGALTAASSGVHSAGNVTLSAAGLVTITDSGVSATAGTGTVQVTSTAAGITLNSGGVRAQGNITLQSSGDISIADAGVVNTTGTGTISVTASTGSISLSDAGLVSTAAVTVTATAGSVTTPDTDPDVTAPSLTVSAATGIELDTLITTLTSATVTGTGSIDISDSAGGLTVTSASTVNGSITLNATGGDLTLTSISAGGTGADVTGTTTTSGSILVASITAADSVNLTAAAAGSINETSADTDADITAASASLTGPAGIGNTSPIEVNLTTLTLAATTDAAAPISLSDTAGGLTVTSASTTDGSITLSADSGDLTLTSVTAGGSNNIIVSTTTSGSILVNSVTAAGDRVTMTSAGGIAESGSDSAADITAASTSLTAATGIGSAAVLEIAVSTLAISNTTSGTVQLANNSGGTLTIGSVGSLNGLTNSAGALSVSTTGAMSIDVAVSASGDISLSAIDTSAATDHLTLNGVSVVSSGGSVTLSAGDNLTIPVSGSVRAVGGGTVTLNADTTDADAPDVGSILLILGTIDFSGSASGFVAMNTGNDDDTILLWDGADGATINCGTGSLTVNAGAGNDTLITGDAVGTATLTANTTANGVTLNGEDGFDAFVVQASLTASFQINGGTPDNYVMPGYFGDTLEMHLGAADNVVFTLTGVTTGFGSSSNAGPVNATSIEYGVLLPRPGEKFDVVVDMNSSLVPESDRLKGPNGDALDTILITNTDVFGDTYTSIIYQADPTSFDILFWSPTGTLNSVTVLGSEDDDRVLVSEDITLGLPDLSGDTMAQNGHVNSTFTGLTFMTTAGIHFDGGAGTDVVGMFLVSNRDIVFTPDLDAGSAAASGNVGIDNVLAISFENVETQLYLGAGGSLIVDAAELTTSGDLPLLALADYGTAADGMNVLSATPSTNFPSTLFSGFGDLQLSGGASDNQLFMHSVDQSTPASPTGAQPLNDLLINGATGNDQIVFLSTFGTWTGALEVYGGDGATDQVVFQSSLTLAANNDLYVDSESIVVLAPLAVTGTGLLELNGTGTGTSPSDIISVFAPLSSGSGGIGLTGNNLLLDSGVSTSGSGAVTINITGETTITSDGDITADGPVSLTSAGGITSSGDISTTANTIDVHSDFALSGTVRLDSGSGATITLHSPVTGAADGVGVLQLDAGPNGTISLLSTVGGPASNTSRIATLEIVDSYGATFADTVRTSTSVVVSSSRRDRDIVFNGAIVTPLLDAPADPRHTNGVTYPSGFEFDDEYNLFIYGTGSHIGTATLSNKGELRLGDDPADTLIFEDGIFAVGQSAIYLQAIPRTYGAPVELGDEDTIVYINSGTTVIDTTWGPNGSGTPTAGINPTGANIILGGYVVGVTGAGGENLTLNAGTDGNVTLLRNVGTAPGVTARVGTLLVTMAHDVTVNNVLAELFRQEDGTGTTTLNGVINTNSGLSTNIYNIVHANAPAPPTPLADRFEPLGVDLLNVNIVVNDLITTRDTTAGGVRLQAMAGASGVITLNNNGTINSSQIVVLEANATTGPAIIVNALATGRMGGPGEDEIVGTQRQFLTTTDADVEFRGNVSMVAGPASRHADIFFINTGGGAGNITFTGTVDLNLSDLDVRSGLGNINFRGAVSEVHRLFVQDLNDGAVSSTLTGTTVTFVDNLSTELLITAPGAYNVDLLGSRSIINLNDIQLYLPNGTTFRNTGRVTLGNDSSDVVSVIFGLSTRAAAVTNIAGTVELTHGMAEATIPGIALSPVMLTPAGTTTRLRTNSWWPISAMANASGLSVDQAGNNTLILGTGTSVNEYVFSGGMRVHTLDTTLSASRYNLSIHGPLTVTGTAATTFNNRGLLRVGASSANVHSLGGSLTVSSNSDMMLSGQLTAQGSVQITSRLFVQSAGTALIASNTSTVTVAETIIADSVNLTLGSATTTGITATTSIIGTWAGTSSSVAFHAAGPITVAGVVNHDLSDITIVNSTGAEFSSAVTATGTLAIQNSSGAVIFRSGVSAGSLDADAGSGSYDLQLLAGAVTSGAADLQNTGTVTLGDGADAGNNLDVFTFGTGLTRSGGPTAIAGDVRTTNSVLTIGGTLTASGTSLLRPGSGALTLTNVVLNSGAKLDVGAGGSGSIGISTVSVTSGATNTKLRLASTGTATISQAVTGLAELELSDGNSVFSQDVGSPSTRIGAITRTSTAGTTTFSRNLYATDFNVAGGAVSLLGSTTDITNAVTFGTAAMVVLGDGGDTLNFPGGLVHTGGPTTIGGTVTTANTGITLGDVVIPAAATLSTGTGAGDIDMWAVSGSGSLTTLSGQGNTIFRSTISGLTNITVQQAANVDFRGAVTISGNLAQSIAGTGTTTLRGGTIGGTLDVQTVAVLLASGTLTTSGAVSLTGTGSVGLSTGANLNSGSSIVRISAGAGGFVQNGTSLISSGSNHATAAIEVLVSGGGSATLGALTASHASGRIVVTVSGSGSIVDGNDTATTAMINTTGSLMTLSATGGTVGTAANPIEYSSGTISSPNSATTQFVRDLTPGSGSVIGRFDFGRSNVVQDRFVGVTSTALFKSTAAYGTGGSYGFTTRPSEVLRSTVDLGKSSVNLYADSVLGSGNFTFRVRLPNNSSGPYEVRAYFGDRDMATNTVITAISGTTMTSGTLESGLAAAKSFPVSFATVSDTDTDGILTFQFGRPTGYSGSWSVIGMEIASGTGNLPGVAPQILAGLDFAPGGAMTEASAEKLASVERRGEVLSEELVLRVREQVLAAWATTGLSAEAMARLQSTTVEISDLNDRGMLGLSGAAGTTEIWLDDDALGYGWSFTDSADLNGDGEADMDVPEGTIDLATVMAHEYGHILGWQDLDPQQYPGHLMAGELELGERRSVGDLQVAPRGVDAEVPEVSIVVPTRRMDVFREEESVDIGNAITAAPARGGLTAIAYSVKNVESGVDGEVTGDVEYRTGRQVSSGDGVDTDLSLLDDLFADMSLLP